MDLINNMGLQEEVLQRATTNGKLDQPNVSMKEVRKVRPELVTKDPSLLRSFPNGGKDVANMDEDEYITEMLGALGNEYKDDEAMEGMTGGQRIMQLMRKHPKSLDTFFSEVGRRLDTSGDALMQDSANMMKDFAGGNNNPTDGVQQLINATPTFPHMKG